MKSEYSAFFQWTSESSIERIEKRKKGKTVAVSYLQDVTLIERDRAIFPFGNVRRSAARRACVVMTKWRLANEETRSSLKTTISLTIALKI